MGNITRCTSCTENSLVGAECEHGELSEIVPVDDTPSITFESITFSDGTVIDLEPTDVVVLVGPNNAGKSLALRELESYVGRSGDYKVVTSANMRQVGTPGTFKEFITKHTQIERRGDSLSVRGAGFSVGIGGGLEQFWPDQVWHFSSLFCTRILTEQRISDSNAIDSFDPLHELPSHPIHRMLDDRIERRISQYFRRAFGEDLILYRGGGTKAQLLVGERKMPRRAKGEDRASATYWEWLQPSTVSLEHEGDGMRSFASVVLHLLAPTTPSILLLDEPEAFLHPPQARLLGEIIAMERPSRAQLIVATHSPEVLHGLINVASDHLQILRMRREGNINRIRKLEKGLVRQLSEDPLMTYSNVLSGVFHERVIICESDADCMFYSSILNLPDVYGEQQPDVLFVHASGKHRMASLARILSALDVPVNVIVDIDVLREENVLEALTTALGGDWATIQPRARSVRLAIEQAGPNKTAGDIVSEIKEVLSVVPSGGAFPTSRQTEIQRILRSSSPWDAVKESGEAAIPRGQPTQQFHELMETCKALGLWIVPVGELEGFCRPIGRKGPTWLQRVVEEHDLAEDDELEDARQFVREIWHSGSAKADATDDSG